MKFKRTVSGLTDLDTRKAYQYVLNVYIVLGILPMTDFVRMKTRTENSTVSHLLNWYLKLVIMCLFSIAVTVFQAFCYTRKLYETVGISLKYLYDKDSSYKVDVKSGVSLVIYYTCAYLQIGVFWYKAKDLRRFAKQLNQFEILYRENIGLTLQKPMVPTKALVYIFSMTAIGLGIGIPYWIFALKRLGVETFYRSDDLMRLYTDLLWYVLCRAIYVYGKQLRTDFINDFRYGLTENRLFRYEVVRAHLVELTRGVGKVAGKPLAVHLIQEFSLIVVNHFFVLLNTREFMETTDNVDEGLSKIIKLFATHADVGLFLFAEFIRIRSCVNVAHAATNEMGDALKKDLLSEIADHLLTKSPKIKQVKRFLKKVTFTTANISISKHIVLNKGFLFSMLFWVFYCSCTLLQFYDAFHIPPAYKLKDNVTALVERLKECENITKSYDRSFPNGINHTELLFDVP